MNLTYAEALAEWARNGGPKPYRTGRGPYDYRLA